MKVWKIRVHVFQPYLTFHYPIPPLILGGTLDLYIACVPLICTTSLHPYMNTWTLCKKSHVDSGPVSGHNGTAATRSELLFLWWHCCYWLTQVCFWKSLKLVVWGSCSLTKKKITRLVYYLAKLWGEDNVGNFCKMLKRCTLSELLFGSSLALKLEHCPTIERDPAWLNLKKVVFIC